MFVLDIGGTSIKYALTDDSGRIVGDTVGQTPSDAGSTFEAFAETLTRLIRGAGGEKPVRKACVSTPGPFDFENGISLMRHKFPALYGRSLKDIFARCGVEAEFLHDSTAFMLGELHDGAVRGGKAPCCVMLGTGLGFAFAKDGRVCVNAERGPAVSLWNTPWKDGIAEDYVSTRALCALYGEQLPIREIAERARSGDAAAERAFRTVGASLTEILTKIIPELGCDSLVLGGQIAKSADLFGLEPPCEWFVSEHLDDAALRGVGSFSVLGRGACERLPDGSGNG